MISEPVSGGPVSTRAARGAASADVLPPTKAATSAVAAIISMAATMRTLVMSITPSPLFLSAIDQIVMSEREMWASHSGEAPVQRIARVVG
jgi:hypothetical protein